MKYTDFERNVAGMEEGRYEARLDRAKQNVENYMRKNHVHVFDKKKKKEVATINGAARNVTYMDFGLPTKLSELITEYAYTPIKERMADEVSDDDQNHNVMK